MNVLVYFNLLAFHIIVAAENDDSPKIVQGPVDKKVLENSVVSFFCKATGHPPPDISWHRGGKKIGASHTRYTNINMPQGSVLRIDSVKSRRDDVSFECVAHNSNGETAKASAELEVYSEGNVPYGFPRIVENPTLKAVEKNRTVKLICSATGNPDPSITWLKDFIPVDTSDPRFQILSTGTLQIQNSLESDEGKYECVAENSVGVAYSYHANLYVRASLPGPTNVHVERMSPTSIEVTWDPPSFSGIVGYSIFYHTVSTADMESWKSIETGLNTDLEIEGLEPHTVYVVRVRARATGGRQSNFSDIVFTNETEHAMGVEPTFDSSQANVTVVSGGIALLPCSIENLGKYKVAWLDENSFPVSFDDRRVIDDSRFSIVRNTTKDWHLEIRDVREDDRGEYRCTINTHPVKSELINLFVEVLDVEPTFDSSQTNVTVVSGGLALLPCSIEKLGKHRVAWLDASSIALCFDDRTIIEDPRFSIVRNTTKDWHLEIRDVRKDDQGQYRCTINTFPVTSKLINLFVEAPIDSPEYGRTTSDTTLILMLYPVSKFYGPVSHYYLFVIEDEMTENMFPDDFQLDDFLTDDGRSAGQWIAARFDGMVPSEFELGRHSEGVKENTSIQNRPLKLDRTYRVFLRVYTPDNKSTSSPFSQPLSTISGPREHLPFLNDSMLPPVYIIAPICAAVVLVLLVVLIIFTRKGRLSKNDMMNNPSIPDSELKDLIDQLEANEGVSQD